MSVADLTRALEAIEERSCCSGTFAYGQGTARGDVDVAGFDPSAVIDEIAATLSPTVKLSAQLTDAIVYKKGDKFTRHKDTPRSADLVGTSE